MNLPIRYNTNMIAPYIAILIMIFNSHPRKLNIMGSSTLKAMIMIIRIITYLIIVCVKSFI
jgi:hypothetical protein